MADKFFMRDRERITFENDFIMNHHEEYQRLTDYKILDALHTKIMNIHCDNKQRISAVS